MKPEKTTADGSQATRRTRRWRPAAVVIAVLAVTMALLVMSQPEGAAYDEYLQLKEGMPRKKAVAIIGQSDYWHHYEADRDVTNWVNKDGTYIRAVFDKNDVLVEVSWESGWKREREMR